MVLRQLLTRSATPGLENAAVVDKREILKLRTEAMVMTPERLVEEFTTAATATGLAFDADDSTQAQIQSWFDRSDALANVIAERGGQETLDRLCDSEIPYVAYFAARRLYHASPREIAERYKERALATLARIRDLRCGVPSAQAEDSWNKIVYGDPLGPPSSSPRDEPT